MALTDLLSAIGDAIRKKTGTTEKLRLDEMPIAIENIQGGSSGGTDTLIDYIMGKPTKIESDEITSLREGMFNNADNLIELKLPNLQSIKGSYSIYNTGLKSLDFPKLTNLERDSIKSNHDIVYANLPNAIGSETGYYKGFAFSNSSQLTEINIPKVQYLNSLGFESCYNLPKLDLPSVNQIENKSYEHPFGSCWKLTTLILRANQVVQLTDSTKLFNDCPINNGGYNGRQGYIYVPKALLEDYKVATNWSVYADRFRAIEDYPDICGEVAQ